MHWHVTVTRIVDGGSEYLVHNIICRDLDAMIRRYNEAVDMYRGEDGDTIQKHMAGCDVLAASGSVFRVEVDDTCQEEEGE